MTRIVALLAVILAAFSSSVVDPPAVPTGSASRPFALVTHDAIDKIDKYYYRPVSPEDLTAAAVRGLYAHANEKIPAEFAGRVA